METEFYKSIPPEIREKLQEYVNKYSHHPELPLNKRINLDCSFDWVCAPEGFNFWNKHHLKKTFPIWSDELNRFIDPPTPIDINENPNKFYPL